ncbi:B3 domain-containing transcription factor VAL3 [Sesamum alatum]|uniref:B3 domain-containing transcription factor VAL3 n=1 Tax=Sesamum alatum TaxID=300844 RepID=A0AAE1XZ88_9LAMI|nr:B3 domain-containing transcription factor VAL3 [Sesamum alatum]
MASSSSLSCFQCQDSSSNPDHFRNGWRLRSGDYAQLCPRCASVYEEGRFCETFHSNDDGWRDCESCGKLVHCGCIVSFSTHLLLDFGGIICMECSRFNFLLARNRCLSLEPEIRAREPYQERTGQALLEAQCWRRVTDLDLQQVSRNPKATVTPLFEKILSASDADLKISSPNHTKDVQRHFSLIFLACMVSASRYRIQKAMNGNSTTDIGSMAEVGFSFSRGSEIIWSQRNGSQVIQLRFIEWIQGERW